MKRISILTFVLMLLFSCTAFAGDSQASDSDTFKEYLISKALNTAYYFEPTPEVNHLAQLIDGQYYWQQFGSNRSLQKIDYVDPVVGVVTMKGTKRNIVAWAAEFCDGETGHFTEIMIANEEPDGTMKGSLVVRLGDRVHCQQISIEKNKIIVDYLGRKPNQGMALKPTIPKEIIITVN